MREADGQVLLDHAAGQVHLVGDLGNAQAVASAQEDRRLALGGECKHGFLHECLTGDPDDMEAACRVGDLPRGRETARHPDADRSRDPNALEEKARHGNRARALRSDRTVNGF